jgi:hypothetical protein
MKRRVGGRVPTPGMGSIRQSANLEPPAVSLISELDQLRARVHDMEERDTARYVQLPSRERELIHATEGRLSTMSCGLCCCLTPAFLRRGCGCMADTCFTVTAFVINFSVYVTIFLVVLVLVKGTFNFHYFM